MKNKIYLDDYILTYEKTCKYLFNLCNDTYFGGKRFTQNTLGTTNFSFPINSYDIGSGTKHVIVLGTTHGCEILTTYFVLETMISFLLDSSIYDKYSEEFTFHFIPVLNPEGFIISSSNVWQNVCNLDLKSIEKLSQEYLYCYNLDDENARNKIPSCKLYEKVLRSSLDNIYCRELRNSVKEILNSCNLSKCVLPIWSANGVGIDPNANSIHKFCEVTEQRKKLKFGKLRYNNIPNFKPSPIGFPGYRPLSLDCPETYYFNKFVQSLYKSKDEKLIAIFSYHTTGGEIFSYPDANLSSKNNYDLHLKAIDVYKKFTGYIPKDEDLKYGFMDYYRITLENVVSMTIELSRNNANPIGPFADINKILNEVKSNKQALFATTDFIANSN